MIRLRDRLTREKKRLDDMVANCDGNLKSDIILEQSRKVDKLIVAYQKIKKFYRIKYGCTPEIFCKCTSNNVID
jgi:fumarylacetoacetate (FAA) hydrolase family protein